MTNDRGEFIGYSRDEAIEILQWQQALTDAQRARIIEALIQRGLEFAEAYIRDYVERNNRVS